MKNLLSPKKYSSNQLLSNFFIQKLLKNMRVNFRNFHKMYNFLFAQCEKAKNLFLLQLNEKKNSLKKQWIRWFHAIFSHKKPCSTVWKLRNFNATVFSQIFRQINVLLKNFTLNWFDEKKFTWQRISRFSTSHTVQCGKAKNSLPRNLFRQINYSKVL